jgi:nucleotide-binding universal stress UspA family protein
VVRRQRNGAARLSDAAGRGGAARERLDEAVHPRAQDYCTAVALVTRAHRPWQEILRVAGERHADLIVMGVQGRGAVDLMFFGSTTQQVVRQASCPVLTLRGDASPGQNDARQRDRSQ